MDFLLPGASDPGTTLSRWVWSPQKQIPGGKFKGYSTMLSLPFPRKTSPMPGMGGDAQGTVSLPWVSGHYHPANSEQTLNCNTFRTLES